MAGPPADVLPERLFRFLLSTPRPIAPVLWRLRGAEHIALHCRALTSLEEAAALDGAAGLPAGAWRPRLLCGLVASAVCDADGALAFSSADAVARLVPGVLKKDIVRAIFGMAILRFNLQRLTVRTRLPAMARGVRKLGAVFECRQLRVYGPTDAPEHAAEQYVFYRERMERLARGGIANSEPGGSTNVR